MINFIKDFMKDYWLVIVSLIILPFCFKQTAFFPFMDFSNSGETANAINGFTTPIIGFTSVILLYKAFAKQQETIDLQKDINKQMELEKEDNYLSNEFLELEKKVISASEVCNSFKKLKIGDIYFSDISSRINQVTYTILLFNNLIDNFGIKKLKENSENLKKNDERIIFKFNFLFYIIFNDSIMEFFIILNNLEKEGMFNEKENYLLEISNQYQILKDNMEIIRELNLDIQKKI